MPSSLLERDFLKLKNFENFTLTKIYFSDVEPKWENEQNCNGGRLVIEMTKDFRNENLVSNWLNTLLGLIGEHSNVDGVATCYGVQFQSRRKMDKENADIMLDQQFPNQHRLKSVAMTH